MDISSFWSIQHIVIHAHVATAALCIYEYFLTLPDEIDLIWRRQMSLAAFLYLVNRYAFVFYSASGMVQLASLGSDNDIAALLGLSRKL
ncbi:hypothetical protein BC629DRAFT_1596599 [Irpex lacteus]|nr:hypothetical protein BC629DRAFT_1596599 [Irpex lacteus]